MGSLVEAEVIEAEQTNRRRPAVGIPIDFFTDSSVLGSDGLREIIQHQITEGSNALRMWLVGPRRIERNGLGEVVIDAPGKTLGVIQPGAFTDAGVFLDKASQDSWVASVLTDVLTTSGGSVVLESPDRGNVQRETLLQWALPAGIRERLFPLSTEPVVAQ